MAHARPALRLLGFGFEARCASVRLAARVGNHLLHGWEDPSVWGQARLVASSENPKLRRLFFPIIIPTLCKDLVDAKRIIKIEGVDQPVFTKLPLLGGRPILLGLYRALDYWAGQVASGEPGAADFLMKLWEAFLQSQITA